MSNYQGHPVTVVRNAQQGDPNFDATKQQVIIKNADGSQNTVLKTDVQN